MGPFWARRTVLVEARAPYRQPCPVCTPSQHVVVTLPIDAHEGRVALRDDAGGARRGEDECYLPKALARPHGDDLLDALA